MDSPQLFVRRYPNRCTMFNMVQASRVKKGEESDAYHRGGATVSNKRKEKKSEVWTNEDDGNFLIVRLLYPPSEYPWMIAHHGIHEIFKGPLYVPIICTEEDYSCVSVILRDFANRDKETEGRTKHCIVRKFILDFGTKAEASAFKVLHDGMIFEYKESKKEEGKNDRTCATRRTNGKRSKSVSHNLNDINVSLSNLDHSEGYTNPKKRRRISGSNKNCKKDETKEKEKEEKMIKQSLDKMSLGDGYNLLDDDMPNTQDPFDFES